MGTAEATTAVRATVRGRVQGVGFRDAVVRRASVLGALGWVRNADDGTVLVHAEGPEGVIEQLIDFLHDGPPAARVDVVDLDRVKVEGHEQFAVRGVPAGRFELLVAARGFELRLEVGGGLRRWALPREPSTEPSQRRMAIELAGDGEPGGEVWDAGPYEQGGRVPWPEALERGHAVFVLHGERLQGGFALQRTRDGDPPHWLLVKRREAPPPGGRTSRP